MPTVLIIESPGKTKTLTKILGPDYKVVASFGHIRDLPEKGLGVEAPHYRPKYAVTDDRAKSAVAGLRRAIAGAERVVLATDLDREGEAIAWHIADELRLKNPERITYSAVTREAVMAALDAPRRIDMALVHAQEARRVLDRLVGYQVSPAIGNALGQPLSAGRVQSPALRLVVDHERAIRGFRSTTHYQVDMHFTTPAPWTARWKPELPKGEKYFLDPAIADIASKVKVLTVAAFDDTKATAAPPPPFTTSTLQQAAQKTLKIKPKVAMELAQKLYEAGVITYMRTDSPNLSDEACDSIEAYARSMAYPLPEKRRRWKAKGSAQEAHEAIRPSDINVVDAGETDPERELYRLIWKRTLASQLADATIAVRTAELRASPLHIAASRSAMTLNPAPGTVVELVYIARGRTLIDPGWKFILDDKADEDDDGDKDHDETSESNNPVPQLQIGAVVDVHHGDVLTRVTEPPKRFTQASLTKALEKRGIGRPATFVSIFQTLSKRSYVNEDKKGFLSPTDLAEKLIDRMVGTFAFLDYDYTNALESELDAIAEGKSSYLQVVTAANDQLLGELSGVAPGAVHPCPECSSPMRRMKGKSGHFWGCSDYPQCKATLPDAGGAPGVREALHSAVHPCPQCNTAMRRNVRSKADDPAGRGWDFWSCPSRTSCPKTYKTDADGAPVIPMQGGGA
jgi:DNA topoisomerase I